MDGKDYSLSKSKKQTDRNLMLKKQLDGLILAADSIARDLTPKDAFKSGLIMQSASSTDGTTAARSVWQHDRRRECRCHAVPFQRGSCSHNRRPPPETDCISHPSTLATLVLPSSGVVHIPRPVTESERGSGRVFWGSVNATRNVNT